MEELTTSQKVELNTDLTIHRREGSYRKPLNALSIYGMEHSLFFTHLISPTYAFSIYASLINGFSSVFEYDGLPDGLYKGSLEKKLLSNGRVKFIKVGSKYKVVRITPNKFDDDDNVIESIIIEPRLPNLSGQRAEKFQGIEIRNNNMGISLIRLIYPYLYTIDEELFNLETHGRVLAGKFTFNTSTLVNKDNTTMQDALNDWMNNNDPVKVIYKSLSDSDTDGILTPMQVQDSTDSFLKIVKFNMSGLLNALGIPNNINDDKKERLITSEISIQNIMQSAILTDMLDWRKRAIDKINKKFNLKIKVKLMDKIEDLEQNVNESKMVAGEKKV